MYKITAPLVSLASIFALSAVLVLASVPAFGQSGRSRIEFDVASIRPTAPGSRDGGRVRTLAGGQTFTASNVALKFLIVTAYGLRPDQVSGGPAWVNNDGFDIEAKANRPASRDDLMLMLQNLLTNRFRLTVRDEKRLQQVYALVFDKAVPNLKHNSNGSEPLFFPVGLGHYTGTNVSMSYLAWSLGLSAGLGRVVVDKTGLKGGYDFDLQFTRELNGPAPQDGGPTEAGPSLFTAIREQLGLKLESAKEPVDFLTVEHAERPEN
jgi:uncharacterized protein (TIGR03435 family)